MAYQAWQGKKFDYGNGVSLSAVQLEKAQIAAASYDWAEDKTAEYPQKIRCKKTGQMATRRSLNDKIVWDANNINVLMLDINEYSIQDIIV